MATPIILGATVLEAPKLLKSGATLGGAAVISGVVAGVVAFEPRISDALFQDARVQLAEAVLVLLRDRRSCQPRTDVDTLTSPPWRCGPESIGRRRSQGRRNSRRARFAAFERCAARGCSLRRSFAHENGHSARELEMSIDVMPELMTREELADLAEAVGLLESRGFASRLAVMFGSQVEAIGRVLPSSARGAVVSATESALRVALGSRSPASTRDREARLRTDCIKRPRPPPALSAARLELRRSRSSCRYRPPSSFARSPKSPARRAKTSRVPRLRSPASRFSRSAVTPGRTLRSNAVISPFAPRSPGPSARARA